MIVEQTAAYFTSENIILGYEEIGRETDTNKTKYGDGQTAWNDLNYTGLSIVRNHLEVSNPVGETTDVLIDCGTIIAPNENILIDCGSI